MQSTEGFPGQDMQFDGNQRTVIRIKQRVKRNRACQPVANISTCIVDGCDLCVLGITIGNFAITRFDLVADMSEVQQLFSG